MGIGLAWVAVLCPSTHVLGESQSSCHDFELHGMFVFWMCLGKGFIQLALTTQDVDGGGSCGTGGGSYIPVSNTGWLCAFLGVLGGFVAVRFYDYGNLLTTAVMAYSFYYSYSLRVRTLFAVLVVKTLLSGVDVDCDVAGDRKPR